MLNDGPGMFHAGDFRYIIVSSISYYHKSLERLLDLEFLKFLLMNPKRNKQETV